MRIVSGLISGILILGLTACITEASKIENEAVKAEMAGDYDKAKDLYLQSIEKAKTTGEPIHAMVWKATQLSNVSFEQKEELLKLAFKDVEGCKYDDLVLEDRLIEMASFYENSKPPHYAEAEVYLKKILANTVKQNGDIDPANRGFTYKNSDHKLQSPSDAYGRVAWILERQGKYEEAEPLRRKEIEIKSKRSPAPNLYTEKKLLQENLVKQGKAKPEPAKREY